MGTIVFYQGRRAGTEAQPIVPIFRLDDSLIRTVDATTSTSAESITISEDRTILGVIAPSGVHRIAAVSGQTADSSNYITIAENTTSDPNQIFWIAVKPGDVVYYRLDA